MVLKTPFHKRAWMLRLSSESVEGASLALEGVDNVHGSDGLAASVLRVGDGVADDVLQEDLEDSSGLLVDEAADALHSSSAGQTANGRLGDSGNVVAQNLAVTLGASLSESLGSLSSSRHCSCQNKNILEIFFLFFFRAQKQKRETKRKKKQNAKHTQSARKQTQAHADVSLQTHKNTTFFSFFLFFFLRNTTRFSNTSQSTEDTKANNADTKPSHLSCGCKKIAKVSKLIFVQKEKSANIFFSFDFSTSRLFGFGCGLQNS